MVHGVNAALDKKPVTAGKQVLPSGSASVADPEFYNGGADG